MQYDYTIAGAGIAGSYLAMKLANAGFMVDLRDRKIVRGCNCAWGIGLGELNNDLCDTIKKNTEYLEIKSLYINNVRFKTSKFIIINKPHFISNITKTANTDNLKFTRAIVPLSWCKSNNNCINATATPYSVYKYKDITAIPTYQVLIRCKRELHDAIIQFTPQGYVWLFPHPNNQHFIHLGIGDFSMLMPRENSLIDRLIDYVINKLDCKKLCSCGRPLHVNPYIEMPNYAIGEAAGFVHPSSGEGIAPSLMSANLMYNVIVSESLQKQSYYNLITKLTFLNFARHEFQWIRYAHRRNIFGVIKENSWVSDYITDAFGISDFSSLKILPHMFNLHTWHKRIINTANIAMTR